MKKEVQLNCQQKTTIQIQIQTLSKYKHSAYTQHLDNKGTATVSLASVFPARTSYHILNGAFLVLVRPPKSTSGNFCHKDWLHRYDNNEIQPAHNMWSRINSWVPSIQLPSSQVSFLSGNFLFASTTVLQDNSFISFFFKLRWYLRKIEIVSYVKFCDTPNCNRRQNKH